MELKKRILLVHRGLSTAAVEDGSTLAVTSDLQDNSATARTAR